MDKQINLDSVAQYNQLYGLETLHPQICVADLNRATKFVDYTHWHYGIYALYLKMEKQCDIKYGRTNYDYQEGTIVCFAPGQSTEITPKDGRVQLNAIGVLFHRTCCRILRWAGPFSVIPFSRMRSMRPCIFRKRRGRL